MRHREERIQVCEAEFNDLKKKNTELQIEDQVGKMIIYLE